MMSVEIHGVPKGLPLCPEDFAADIARRRPGRKGTTARVETDVPEIVRGVMDGVTTGTTLKIVFRNQNIDPSAYRQFVDKPRPGHADWVRRIKYGADSLTSGGGMFSGRMTLPIVAAGVVAKKVIAPVTVSARLTEIGGRRLEHGRVFPSMDTGSTCADSSGQSTPVGTGMSTVDWSEREVLTSESELDSFLEHIASEGDSVGGIVECTCAGVPAGLGEPFFYPMEAALSQMIFSIPGARLAAQRSHHRYSRTYFPQRCRRYQRRHYQRQPVGLPRGRKAHVQHCPSPADRQSLHGPHGGVEHQRPSRRMLCPARPSSHRERCRHRPLRLHFVHFLSKSIPYICQNMAMW